MQNYQVVKLNRHGKPKGKPGPDQAGVVSTRPGNTVTLSFAHRLNLTRHFRVTVFGSSASGIMGTSGQPLNASAAQVSGSNFVGVMTQHQLRRLGPAPARAGHEDRDGPAPERLTIGRRSPAGAASYRETPGIGPCRSRLLPATLRSAFPFAWDRSVFERCDARPRDTFRIE